MSALRKAVPTALVVGGVVGGLAAALTKTDRATMARWASNPDPLGGIIPAFPDGETRGITVDDGAVINTVTTGDGPTVVLVHGLTGSRHDWGPMALRLLDNGFRVIAVEQRGHGDSTVGGDGFSIPRQARDLAQAIEALDVREAIVAGHSMGGMATMTLALDHPETARDRVRGLALIATRPAATDLRTRVALRIGSSKLTDRVAVAADRNRLSTGLSVFGKNPSLFAVEAAMRGAMTCPPEVRRGATAGIAGYDITDRLGTIGLRTIVMCGTLDKLTPLEENQLIAARIPGAQMHVIADTGHMVIWERPDQLSQLITDFAARSQ